jgi:hypothetical protein
MHLDSRLASTKVRRDIVRQHLRVGTRHIDIYVPPRIQRVEHIVEGKPGRRFVIVRQFRQVNAILQNLPRQLDLINEDVILPVVNDSFANKLAQLARILQRLKLLQIKGDGYDMVFMDSALNQVAAEELVQEIALPATANTSNDFHRTIPHLTFQFFKIFCAFYHVCFLSLGRPSL